MSPIPDFDHNHVLPPHLGNPTLKSDLSPYKCSILELCTRFSTSKERIDILLGFVSFRMKMTEQGIINGFQWLDGSFIENIEKSEARYPNDLDLVTFYGGLSLDEQLRVKADFPEFANPLLAKTNYHLDHYPVDYMFRPDFTVEATRYWIQLFTHNRNNVWKGILHLPINTWDEDLEALDYLKGVII